MISKQVIVVRKDLNMPEGKLAAQVSHASMAPLIEKLRGFSHDLVTPTDTKQRLFIDLIPGDAWKDWIDGRFRKIVVYVKSEQKLLDIFNKAKEAKLPCSLIKDAGFTVFNEPTYTCVGIGPCWAEDVDKITGKLRLL
jgi:PTH2 family peptidyl-tRNA hydrolase